MAPNMTAPIFSLNWKSRVRSKLLEGFGVEDIAIAIDCHRTHVQAYVNDLREDGQLDKWWGK